MSKKDHVKMGVYGDLWGKNEPRTILLPRIAYRYGTRCLESALDGE